MLTVPFILHQHGDVCVFSWSPSPPQVSTASGGTFHRTAAQGGCINTLFALEGSLLSPAGRCPHATCESGIIPDLLWQVRNCFQPARTTQSPSTPSPSSCIYSMRTHVFAAIHPPNSHSLPCLFLKKPAQLQRRSLPNLYW